MPRLASGHVDALVEHPGCGDRVEAPDPQIVQDLPPLTPRGRAGDEVDRHQRIQPVDGVIGGADGLGEHQRAVRVADRRREAAEQLVLPARLRDDLTPLREGVEVLAGGTTVGAGVALGEVRDRGEEVAERLERHPRHPAEVVPSLDQLLFGRGVLGPLPQRQLDADERHPRGRAHAVGDGLVEAVAVADAAEVGHEQLGDRVVAAFERGGEPEPLLVLREHRPPQGGATEAVALVGDQETGAAVRRHRLVGCRRMAGGDEHVARGRTVGAAVTEATDPGVGQRLGQASAPLLHQHPRGHDDEHEAAPAQRVGRRRDGHVGLARPGDRLDHPATPTAQPADQRVELPAVELTIFDPDVGEHGSASPGSEHGASTVPAPAPDPVRFRDGRRRRTSRTRCRRARVRGGGGGGRRRVGSNGRVGAPASRRTRRAAHDDQLPQLFQHRAEWRPMSLGADLVERGRDLARLVDDERGADDAHVLAPVVDLLAPRAVLLGDGVLGVGEQLEPEAVLLVELRLLLRGCRVRCRARLPSASSGRAPRRAANTTASCIPACRPSGRSTRRPSCP